MSLVTDIVTDVLIRFPIIAQRLKGTYYFHRVVGLVVISNSVIINIPQWLHTQQWGQVAIQLHPYVPCKN